MFILVLPQCTMFNNERTLKYRNKINMGSIIIKAIVWSSIASLDC